MLVFSAGMNPNIYRLRDIRATVKPTADGLSARAMWGERNYGAEALPECHSRDICRGELSGNFKNDLITMLF